jgi:hypothetical protein
MNRLWNTPSSFWCCGTHLVVFSFWKFSFRAVISGRDLYSLSFLSLASADCCLHVNLRESACTVPSSLFEVQLALSSPCHTTSSDNSVVSDGSQRGTEGLGNHRTLVLWLVGCVFASVACKNCFEKHCHEWCFQIVMSGTCLLDTSYL